MNTILINITTPDTLQNATALQIDNLTLGCIEIYILFMSFIVGLWFIIWLFLHYRRHYNE